MKRRDFERLFAAGSVGVITANCERASTPRLNTAQSGTIPKQALMHVGCQSGGVNREDLEFKARHGVFHIDGGMPRTIPGKGWDLEDSLKKKEMCESYGISLEAYHLPLSSSGIERVRYPNILLGKSPDRDREIEIIRQMIEVAGKTGIRLLQYNTTILPVLRTGRTPGRGGSSYSTWDYETAVRRNEPETIAGEVSVDELYERITYLLDRLLPVAEEWKVQLGNHITDPPTHAGYRGVTRWTHPDVFAGIKRFAGLYDNPYHGFNLCIGSTASGMQDPNTEIHAVIRWLGERRQIFNVHFRNIIGGWDKFREVYPDNGDMDLLSVARTFRDVEYPYMLMPDHVPTHPDDPGGKQAFAFAYGYIKALIRAVNSETT